MYNERALFSIVVPVYKVEPYLEECVESLIGQTYSHLEILLVDDGSPDGCPAICDRYAEKDGRVRVIHKENGGAGSARKTGALEARGEYILCVDGDDRLAENAVSRFAEALTETGADVVVCGHLSVYEDHTEPHPQSKWAGKYDRKRMEEEIFPSLIQAPDAAYFPPSVWGKAYKTELYRERQLQVDDRIKIGEDGACVLPILFRAASIAVIPDCLYGYRQNPTSITKERRAFSWDGPELIHRHLTEQIGRELSNFEEQIARKTVHELFSVVVSQFYRKEPLKDVKRDIIAQLEKPVYCEAIRHAKFSGAKPRLMHFALRHRLLWLIRFWAKVK